MKKTISTNLANRSFYIEEEAYNMLDAYLKGIDLHYKDTDPDGEIVGDIEERLSEIFASKMRLGHEVITREITTEAMKQMGPLEDIVDEPIASAAYNQDNGQTSSGFSSTGRTTSEAHEHDYTTKEETQKRKLYKDPNDKWISGFFGGLAKYSGLDPIFIRIAFLLLLFTPLNWALLLVYISCAIFVPTAHTVTQRLEMEGKQINPDSIWKKVSEESSQMAQTFTGHINDLGKTFKVKKEDKANNPVVEEPLTPEAQEVAKRKNKTSKTIYGIVGIAVIVALTLSLIWLITSLSTGDLFEPWYWDNFWEDSAFRGIGILLIISMVIIGLLVLAGLFALLILPVGLILKSNSSTGWKVIGILVWIAFLSMFLFH